MTVEQRPFIGGPGCYGFDMEDLDHVSLWIVEASRGGDNPRCLMTPEEKESFDRSIYPISKYSVEEQQLYFGLIRKGFSLATAREIAGYDSLV